MGTHKYMVIRELGASKKEKLAIDSDIKVMGFNEEDDV